MKNLPLFRILLLAGELAWLSTASHAAELMIYANTKAVSVIREVDGSPCKTGKETGFCQTTSRLSFDLRLSKLRDGHDKVPVRVEDLYLTMFAFPFSLVLEGPKKTTPEKHLGLTLSPGDTQFLSLDPKLARIDGKLRVRLYTPLPSSYEATSHFSKEPVRPQEGILTLNIYLSPGSVSKLYDDTPEIAYLEAQLDVIRGTGVTEEVLWMMHFMTRIWPLTFTLQKAFLDRLVSTRVLCVQPVKIRSDPDDANETGEILPEGVTHAQKLWFRLGNDRKPVRLKVQNAITIDSPDLKELRMLHSSDYRGLVDSPDCIEVYVATNPTCAYGGGATWGRGNDDAYAIISDLPDLPGVLAHELGHVMNFPDAEAANADFVSGGTVMCTKGTCTVDNPNLNSRFNIDAAHNTLFTVGVAFAPSNADCDHADCGICP